MGYTQYQVLVDSQFFSYVDKDLVDSKQSCALQLLKRFCISPGRSIFSQTKLIFWANKRSGLLFKSVGATAGNHNLRPLSNHTNCTPLCLVVSECVRLCVQLFISSHQGLCTRFWQHVHTSTHAVCVSTFCVLVSAWMHVHCLCVCVCLYCKWSCNHCHTWPFVLPGGLVCWLVPALPFSQVLLPHT